VFDLPVLKNILSERIRKEMQIMKKLTVTDTLDLSIPERIQRGLKIR